MKSNRRVLATLCIRRNLFPFEGPNGTVIMYIIAYRNSFQGSTFKKSYLRLRWQGVKWSQQWQVCESVCVLQVHTVTAAVGLWTGECGEISSEDWCVCVRYTQWQQPYGSEQGRDLYWGLPCLLQKQSQRNTVCLFVCSRCGFPRVSVYVMIPAPHPRRGMLPSACNNTWQRPVAMLIFSFKFNHLADTLIQ